MLNSRNPKNVKSTGIPLSIYKVKDSHFKYSAIKQDLSFIKYDPI